MGNSVESNKERLAQLLREYPTWGDAALDLQDKLSECQDALEVTRGAVVGKMDAEVRAEAAEAALSECREAASKPRKVMNIEGGYFEECRLCDRPLPHHDKNCLLGAQSPSEANEQNEIQEGLWLTSEEVEMVLYWKTMMDGEFKISTDPPNEGDALFERLSNALSALSDKEVNEDG